MNMGSVVDTLNYEPVSIPKTRRSHYATGGTSCKAGKMIPLWFSEVLREDQISRGSFSLSAEMMETVQRMVNAVSINLSAWFVPYLAMDWFSGMDDLNASWSGVPLESGGSVKQFYKTVPYSIANEFWKQTGYHAVEGATVNAQFLAAYNRVVHFRYRSRSVELPARLWNDTTLARAFWSDTGIFNLVPHFNSAMIDGEVSLSLAGSLPVTGIGISNPPGTGYNISNRSIRETGGTNTTKRTTDFGSPSANPLVVVDASDVPQIFAQLTAANVRMTLAGLQQARDTQAWAKVKQRYQGLEDDYLIDLLMNGLEIPDVAYREPMLLSRESAIFGMTTRFSTDAASLAKNVTTGRTELNLRYAMPRVNCGGVIVVMAEIVPEQLYERKLGTSLRSYLVADRPAAMRDMINPQPIRTVKNAELDALHSVPNGTLGYQPMNGDWQINEVLIGGKFKRPVSGAWTENRGFFWSATVTDPAYNTDLLLVPQNLPHDVFADSTADPFELFFQSSVDYVGLTQFGGHLVESQNEYEEVLAKETYPAKIDPDEPGPAT